MASPLTDLDELALLCRNHKAKAYISEAIASYKVGAFRSSIVSTWIAVCFDYIDKLRELAISGDVEAERQLEDVEKTRVSGDPARALKFERELLDQAKNRFELISHLEWIDLTRLRDDRNRCAHPSLVSEEQAYSPSAELARTHLHAAVIHLLQHQPAQGKYALERLISEVGSEYFPTDHDKALVALTSGPLKKARTSLVRNFMLLLIKAMLKEDGEYKPRMRKVAALRAVKMMYHEVFVHTCQDSLSAMFRTVADTDLLRSVKLLVNVPDCWQYLDEDIQHRLETYVKELPSSTFDYLEEILGCGPLKKAAEQRIGGATASDIRNAFFFITPDPVIERLIKLYLMSSSFDQANEISKQLSTHSSELNAEHVRAILIGIKANPQVLHSFELGPLIHNLSLKKKLPEAEFDQLLRENGLEMFADAAPQDEDFPL